MKRILKISAMAFLVMLFADIRNTATAQPVGDVSYQTFYDELSPYGRWIEYPEYGYVWCPDEGADFRPYSTNGRWVWNDDYDWMWVSDYSWGWAPFHYGRWFYDPLYGWMWVPGYDWSPAWVAWRGSTDYYGWAPLMPGINIGVGFSWNNYNCPTDYWCFTPNRYFTSPRLYNYCVSPRQNVTIINNTTIINNNYNIRRNVYVNGPGRRDVERYTNERIRSVRVREANAPGRNGFRRNNEVAVYRPSIRRDNDNRNIAPRRFDQYRGNNNIARNNDNNDNRGNNTDRFQRNGNSNTENRISDRRNDNNTDRRNTLGNRVERNNNSTERRNTLGTRVQRNDEHASRAERRHNNIENNNAERLSRDLQQRQVANERSAREMTERNDRLERRNAFERRDNQAGNENRARNENNNSGQPRVLRNDNSNRNFSGNTPQRQERRDVFNNRSSNQPQQRQGFPQTNRSQEQPRRFESQPRRFESQPRRSESQPRNNNNNNGGNRRSFNRDR